MVLTSPYGAKYPVRPLNLKSYATLLQMLRLIYLEFLSECLALVYLHAIN